MQIQVLKENLVKTIQLATKFTSTRSQLPVLSHLAIEATDEGVFVTATSLDTGVRLRMAGKILEKGSVVVPGKLMSEVVQSLPLGSVELISTDEGLQVIGQRMKARLQVMSITDFPPFPVIENYAGELSIGQIETALKRVGFSFSTDESRPVLTGVLWRLEAGELVTTDGYRLSLVKGGETFVNTSLGVESIVLPAKLLIQLVQAFREAGVETVKFGLLPQSQQVMLVGGDAAGVVRLLSGEYPRYEAIIPTGSDLEFSVDRGQLLAAVRAAAVFARDSANIVRMKVDETVLKISANTPQVGEQEVEVELKSIKPGSSAIAFNAKYFIDFLSHSDANEVGFGMTDPLRPGLFYEVGNSAYTHVIMPVRVRD